VSKLCFSTKLLSMKTPVALESTSVCTKNDLKVLVVLKKIERYRKVPWASRALIVGHKKSLSFT